MSNMQFYLEIWVQLNEVLKVLKVDAGEYESLIGFATTVVFTAPMLPSTVILHN